MVNTSCELIERVEKILADKYINATVYNGFNERVVCVEIHWGDWKHDHLRAKFILDEIGGRYCKTEITEENGSDCYSAVHYFLFPWNWKEEGLASV